MKEHDDTKGCAYKDMPPDLVRKVVEACREMAEEGQERQSG